MQKIVWGVVDTGTDEHWVFTEESLAIEFREKYIDKWVHLAENNTVFTSTREELEEEVVIYNIEANTPLETYWARNMAEFERNIMEEKRGDM